MNVELLKSVDPYSDIYSVVEQRIIAYNCYINESNCSQNKVFFINFVPHHNRILFSLSLFTCLDYCVSFVKPWTMAKFCHAQAL